jgi:hypothetical protein
LPNLNQREKINLLLNEVTGKTELSPALLVVLKNLCQGYLSKQTEEQLNTLCQQFQKIANWLNEVEEDDKESEDNPGK